MIKVLIVDDSALVRRLLVEIPIHRMNWRWSVSPEILSLQRKSSAG